MAVQVSEASMQQGIVHNFLMYPASGAMIMVPIFISLFYHKPIIDTFYKSFLIRVFLFLVWCYTRMCL